jgi:hypothetical protein
VVLADRPFSECRQTLTKVLSFLVLIFFMPRAKSFEKHPQRHANVGFAPPQHQHSFLLLTSHLESFTKLCFGIFAAAIVSFVRAFVISVTRP